MGTATKSVVVNAPVEQVYTFWRNFENFPRFMDNIESIKVTGDDMSHWKSKGPLGMTVEWDAKTTSVQENKKIAWQSTEGTIERTAPSPLKKLATARPKSPSVWNSRRPRASSAKRLPSCFLILKSSWKKIWDVSRKSRKAATLQQWRKATRPPLAKVLTLTRRVRRSAKMSKAMSLAAEEEAATTKTAARAAFRSS